MTTLALAVVPAPAHHPAHHHHQDCRTPACYRRVARWLSEQQRRRLERKPREEAGASWYGPRDSGGALACTGKRLTSSSWGVANKTLPCGTRVLICMSKRGGRCVLVPVVDRGPYIAGRSWDLTEAAAGALGFLSRGAGSVWVAR